MPAERGTASTGPTPGPPCAATSSSPPSSRRRPARPPSGCFFGTHARDPAAVIDYRLDLTQVSTRGPLPPCCPASPPSSSTTPPGRTTCPAAINSPDNSPTTPTARRRCPRPHRPRPGRHVQLWRAAHQTPDTDLRPTGAPRPAEHHGQRRLEPASSRPREWVSKITEAAPRASDPTLPAFAAHLARLAQRRPDLDRTKRQRSARAVV